MRNCAPVMSAQLEPVKPQAAACLVGTPVQPQQCLSEGGERAEDHDQARPHAGGALQQEEQLPGALETPTRSPSRNLRHANVCMKSSSLRHVV